MPGERHTSALRRAELLIERVGISRLFIADMNDFLRACEEEMMYIEPVPPAVVAKLTDIKSNRLSEQEQTEFLSVCRIMHMHPHLLLGKSIRIKWYRMWNLENNTLLVNRVERMIRENEVFYEELYAPQRYVRRR